MDKPFLPKKLSLSDAISELKLDGDDFSYSRAVNHLLKYAEDGDLKIYFNSNILGYESDGDTTKHYDSVGFVLLESINDDITPVTPSNGEIRFLSGLYEDQKDEPCYISVSKFQQNGTDYNSVNQANLVNQEAQVLHPSDHNEEYFYIHREDLQQYINHNPKGVTETVKPKFDGVDYLNPEHKNYSVELHAAINAWNAADQDEDKYKSFKQKVEQYLKNSDYPLSTEAKKRISTVANSNSNKRSKEK